MKITKNRLHTGAPQSAPLFRKGEDVLVSKYKYHTTIYNGKNKSPINIYANTKSEFDLKIATAKMDLKNGKRKAEKGVFEFWAEKWIIEQKIPQLESGDIKQQTFDAYRACLNHLINEFGSEKIEEITLSDMQSFINRLARKNKNTGKPTSKKTIKDILTIWDNIVHFAELNNVAVPKFRKRDIKNSGQEANKRYALELEEQDMIINTPHRAQLPAMIMLFAGLRKSEVGALKWEHIDFNHRIIDISQSVVFEKDKATITPGGKTYAATRQVPLCPILYDYLISYKKKYRCKSGLLVKNQYNEVLSKTSWRRLWSSYIDDLNIKYGLRNKASKHRNTKYPLLIRKFTPHWLRHTFATILYLQKFDVMHSKQILGHADIRTTANTYTDMENFNIYTLDDEFKRRLENEYKVQKEL